MKSVVIFFVLTSVFLVSCSQIRQSAGVNRKNIDEYKIIENPPLIIPPDFDLLPPEQLSEKKLENTESDLAKEILFGLDEEFENDNVEISTINNILNQSKANEISNNIREEIDEEFASEKNYSLTNWEDEVEILDAISESERLRNQNLDIDNDENEIVPTIKIKNKAKKKKRFFFF